MKKIVCLYGGPGTGKSTASAGLFFKLKNLGYNCELVREYVKDWAWEGRPIQEGDQTYLFAKQARKERTYMQNNMDFIITDSPLILTHYYGLKYDWMEQQYNTSRVMLSHHHGYCKKMGYKVDHFFLERQKAYNPAGRFQDEETAKTFDTEISTLLTNFGIEHDRVVSNEEGVNKIVEMLTGGAKE